MFFDSGESSYVKGHKTTHRHHERYKQGNDKAARRSTFHISMPAKVAKLILPRITNRNQETIIRIYPDKAAESQNQTGRNFLMSLSYKKLNESTPQDSLFRDPQCGGGCCCCPDSECCFFCWFRMKNNDDINICFNRKISLICMVIGTSFNSRTFNFSLLSQIKVSF